MFKMSLQNLKDLFLVARIKSSTKTTKHSASKKGYKHQHNLSKGQLNHLAFLAEK